MGTVPNGPIPKEANVHQYFMQKLFTQFQTEILRLNEAKISILKHWWIFSAAVIESCPEIRVTDSVQ